MKLMDSQDSNPGPYNSDSVVAAVTSHRQSTWVRIQPSAIFMEHLFSVNIWKYNLRVKVNREWPNGGVRQLTADEGSYLPKW